MTCNLWICFSTHTISCLCIQKPPDMRLSLNLWLREGVLFLARYPKMFCRCSALALPVSIITRNYTLHLNMIHAKHIIFMLSKLSIYRYHENFLWHSKTFSGASCQHLYSFLPRSSVVIKSCVFVKSTAQISYRIRQTCRLCLGKGSKLDSQKSFRLYALVWNFLLCPKVHLPQNPPQRIFGKNKSICKVTSSEYSLVSFKHIKILNQKLQKDIKSCTLWKFNFV